MALFMKVLKSTAVVGLPAWLQGVNTKQYDSYVQKTESVNTGISALFTS